MYSHVSNSSKLSDTYTSFEQLKKNEPPKNYKIESNLRKSDVLVLAVHGGYIEPGTSEIAKSLAGSNWSYYSFKGLMPSGNLKLHITSHKFNEPKALEMTKKHEICISLHGYRAQANDPNICFGGRNDELASLIHKRLQEVGLQNTDEFNGCGRFYGQKETNIVNLCELEGVQMEFSMDFRNKLTKDKTSRRRFNKAVQSVVTNYLNEAHK